MKVSQGFFDPKDFEKVEFIIAVTNSTLQVEIKNPLPLLEISKASLVSLFPPQSSSLGHFLELQIFERSKLEQLLKLPRKQWSSHAILQCSAKVKEKLDQGMGRFLTTMELSQFSEKDWDHLVSRVQELKVRSDQVVRSVRGRT